MTLSGPRVWRLLHFSGTVKLLLSPGKAGGLLRRNYFVIKSYGRAQGPAPTVATILDVGVGPCARPHGSIPELDLKKQNIIEAGKGFS